MTITKAKYCTTCRSASSTLYRCRYNNQKIWIFLCASCLKKVKKDFPNTYQYGGTKKIP